MALTKASDISTVVHKSIESLQELAVIVQTKRDFAEPFDQSNIEVIIAALQELNNDRIKLHESLESETITASALRYTLHRMPSKIKDEIQGAVLSARQSNEEQIEKLQENLRSINTSIDNLEARNKELLSENSKLEPERNDMQNEHNAIVALLNQQMADKASKQITLNETRDTLRETYKMIIELEDSIIQLKEDLALEREEAVEEKERLHRAVEDTQTKVDDQKKANLEKRKDIEKLQEELVDSETVLDSKRQIIRRIETSKGKLEAQVVQLSRQLQKEIKGNSILTQEGMKIMKIHQDIVTDLGKLKNELEYEAEKLKSTLETAKLEDKKITAKKEKLDEECEAVTEESEKLTEQVREYERRLKRSRDQLQSRNEECARIKEENLELEEEINQLKESHVAMAEAFNKRIDDFKSSLRNERKERQTHQVKRDSVSKEATEFKTEYGTYMGDLSDSVQEAKSEHAKLTERGNYLQKQLKDDEYNILDKQQRLKNSKLQYTTVHKKLKEELKILQESLAKLDNAIKERRNTVNEKTPVYEELEHHFQDSSNDFSELKKSIVDLKNRKASLETSGKRISRELEKMSEPRKKLQEELKNCRAEALRDLVRQNEETKDIEVQNASCCQKLSVVLKENQRFKEANEKVLMEIKSLEKQAETSRFNQAKLKQLLSVYQAELLTARIEDLKLDKVFAERDLQILDDIQKLQDETKGRELKVDGIHLQLQNQLSLLTSFIDGVANLRPTGSC